MGTPVWIVGCLQAPNLSGTTLAAQCPVAQRTTIQTTLEFFQQAATAPADPIPLDSATVFAVFSTSFSVAVLFFLVARGVGTVLRLIRFG
jgi:hypothetical protein